MKIKKILASILIFTCLLGQPQVTHAALAWGTLNIFGSTLGELLAGIREQIIAGINSAAKMAAIKQATSMIESALYGGSSSPRNINNYTDFLINDPLDKTVTYTESFLTNALRGTTSVDYKSSGGGALSQSIEKAGQAIIDDLKGETQKTITYTEYCQDNSFFVGGNYDCFDSLFSNSINTPFGMYLETEAVSSATYQSEQLKAQLMATSTGVLPTLKDNGDVLLVSSIVNEVQLQQITLPLEALANGDSGVFSSAIQSFAVGLIMKIVKNGVDNAANNASKNIDAYKRQYNEQMQEVSNQVGPALNYVEDTYSTGQKLQQQNPSTTK